MRAVIIIWVVALVTGLTAVGYAQSTFKALVVPKPTLTQNIQGGARTGLTVQPAERVELQYKPNAVTLQSDPVESTVQGASNYVQ